MKTSTVDRRNRIQWTLLGQLEDFADDLALPSHSHQQMQNKTTELAATSSQVGLNIYEGKTKILKISTASEDPVTLCGSKLDEVEIFYIPGQHHQQTGRHRCRCQSKNRLASPLEQCGNKITITMLGCQPGFAKHLVRIKLLRYIWSGSYVEGILASTATSLWNANQAGHPDQEFLRRNDTLSGPCGPWRSTDRQLWHEDRSQTRLPSVTFPFPPGDQLDDEDIKSGQKKQDPVDTVRPARGLY
ncbi:hypothetical protein AWC38_SpisGene1263 [Stylophora pistillata]|uniref:Reverse transcriptase domain-containing protein n=1 Tax=Stylophora pistillata TaxID=50429 RepID=A0A2B4ST28_STYPI|nr:hypothetical protein AWC38_SpisGene1263 [Stylophora pistillata]